MCDTRHNADSVAKKKDNNFQLKNVNINNLHNEKEVLEVACKNVFRNTTTNLLCYGECHDFIEQTYRKEVRKAELG